MGCNSLCYIGYTSFSSFNFFVTLDIQLHRWSRFPQKFHYSLDDIQNCCCFGVHNMCEACYFQNMIKDESRGCDKLDLLEFN
ncbi:hypothetical protein P8452_25545 [Trifolium repens]|nr:hypothetical protein P8452_25545 [Trifolium repens]